MKLQVLLNGKKNNPQNTIENSGKYNVIETCIGTVAGEMRPYEDRRHLRHAVLAGESAWHLEARWEPTLGRSDAAEYAPSSTPTGDNHDDAGVECVLCGGAEQSQGSAAGVRGLPSLH